MGASDIRIDIYESSVQIHPSRSAGPNIPHFGMDEISAEWPPISKCRHTYGRQSRIPAGAAYDMERYFGHSTSIYVRIGVKCWVAEGKLRVS